jgi:hypothetical protein
VLIAVEDALLLGTGTGAHDDSDILEGRGQSHGSVAIVFVPLTGRRR